MNMRPCRLLILAILFSGALQAEPLRLSRGAWRLDIGGFAEASFTDDSRASFLESVGDLPARGPDTPRGTEPRRTLSLRHSRVNFTLAPSEDHTWHPKAVLELDLMGNRVSPSFNDWTDTYYTVISPRIRHLYFSAEHDGLQYRTGQDWSLFGWQPSYFVTTVSAPPGPGVIYQRTRQFTLIQTLRSHARQLQLGLSFASASQKAGGVPNLDFGAKFSLEKRRSGFASATGPVQTEPLSFALSGTARQFATGSTSAISDDLKKVRAFAGAANLLVPLLASPDGQETARTLTLTAEFSAGTGHGGVFPDWSGNIPQMPFVATTPAQAQTHLDPGYGGFDSGGDFHLFRLESWNAQLQYHFSSQHPTFTTLGHAQLSVKNIAGLGPVAPGSQAYDRVSMSFLNLIHDVSNNWRAAVEFAEFNTRYIDGHDDVVNRWQGSVLYRF